VAGVAAGLELPGGADLYFFGDLPLGSGLSSSANPTGQDAAKGRSVRL
jgi:galactokinase